MSDTGDVVELLTEIRDRRSKSRGTKPRFYKSFTFWIGLAVIVFLIGDTLGVLIPAYRAGKAKYEQDRAAQQVEQK